nr:hypothetical protein [Streptomyces barringtoniae]
MGMPALGALGGSICATGTGSGRQRHRGLAQPTHGEGQYRGAGRVDPRRVIGHQRQRAFGGGGAEQGEYGCPGGQRVRGSRRCQVEEPAEDIALRAGQEAGVRAQWVEHLVDHRETDPGLELRAAAAQYTPADGTRPGRGDVEQRGLPDPWVTTQQQPAADGAVPGAILIGEQ